MYNSAAVWCSSRSNLDTCPWLAPKNTASQVSQVFNTPAEVCY